MSFQSLVNTFLGITDAFVGGYNAVTGIRNQLGNSHGRIDHLCQQLGWSVDGRHGETISLRFHHPALGSRDVIIVGGDEAIVSFVVFSALHVPREKTPADAIGYMLTRNHETTVGGWFADVNDDSSALFGLAYRVMGPGLDAPALKLICEAMVAEVCAFDTRMQVDGLL